MLGPVWGHVAPGASIRAIKNGAKWPGWWDWEIEFTPHLGRRMEDRNFTEVDLPGMLRVANRHRADVVEGRFVIESRLRGQSWEVVVEPDTIEELLVVITAYKVDKA